ncbi:MAG: hypothetical protein AVDCRST_MAG77-822 [uncultured Chloroflexi bacterium]|uniref:Uncharacterized protein n=1 Tax=uncultured Chloroflexota bacterium TaxID=166587 RepID=A0A6J4HPQ5_9CHLR|nr:MAG: hypothetical protein AVDCRST_MAG77-822 [uncultured Chloroflexota bacterium]
MAVLVGTFDTADGADAAVARLREAGFSDGDLSLISRPGEAVDAPLDPEARGHRTVDAAAIGAAVGAVVGGALLGPIGAVLGGVAAGGGLATVLNSRGVQQADAAEYERRLQAGAYVLAVEAGDRVAAADAALTAAGAERITVKPQ